MRTSKTIRPRKIRLGGLLFLPLLMISPLWAQEPSQPAFTQRLPIPPLLAGTRRGGETVYELTAQTGSRTFFQDTDTLTNGSFLYRLAMSDLMHGLIGDTYLVNGAIKPYLSVGKELIRFRLLSGSNSSIHRFSFSDATVFSQIASDGGFLEQPVEMNSLILSPGERAEILLDLRSRETGDSLYLFTETFQGPRDEVLKIVVADRESRSHTPATQIPGRLVSIAEIPASQSLRSRRFDLETMEIPHSFHLHGVRFQILDINGKNPPAGESGWKDTVLVWPGDTVRIIIPFREFPGIYMYHCHLLEHEDDGMMGQFEVVP